MFSNAIKTLPQLLLCSKGQRDSPFKTINVSVFDENNNFNACIKELCAL